MFSEVQVVPDIDDDTEKKESASVSVSNNDDLETKLNRSQDSILPSTKQQTVVSSGVASQTTHRQPIIHRLSQDARPLTAAEMLAHRRLLSVCR